MSDKNQPSTGQTQISGKTGLTRRHVLGGLGAGLAATAFPNILKAQDKEHTMEKLQNPTDKYPRPPFKSQSQPWPGLASKMDPRPDHGESSYKGSGRLLGRKALITGGDSGMGRAAAIAYAREGADVAINYFPTEEPDAKEVIALIKAEGRKAIALPGDLREEDFCRKLVDDAVSGLGGLDILVSNAGRQQSKPSILDITTEDFDATIKTNIYAPFWIIKAALPHLPPGAVIIGTTSEQAYDPSPSNSLPGGFALMALPRVLFGLHFRSAAAPVRRSCRNSAGRLPWEGPASPLSWLPSTSSSPPAMPATLRARFTALPAALGNPELDSRRGNGRSENIKFGKASLPIAPTVWWKGKFTK